MKKVLYTDFVATEEIILTMLETRDIKKALTRSNLYKFWKKIVGEKFYDNSKPYSLIGNTMIVACKNAIVAQELVLHKMQLITKLQPYLKGLKITVKDLKFDAKKWCDEV